MKERANCRFNSRAFLQQMPTRDFITLSGRVWGGDRENGVGQVGVKHLCASRNHFKVNATCDAVFKYSKVNSFCELRTIIFARENYLEILRNLTLNVYASLYSVEYVEKGYRNSLHKLLSPHERTPLWITQCYFVTLRKKYLDHLCGWFWNKFLDRNCGRFSKPLGIYKLKEMARELQKTTRYFGKLLIHGSNRSPYIFLKIKARFKK